MLFLTTASLMGSSDAPSNFDERYEAARSHNPTGIKFVIRTKEDRTTFHLFETIPIQLVFSSSVPSTYSIELNENMNFAGATLDFDVEPAESTSLTWISWGLHGVVCCDSVRRFLTKDPTIFNRELTDYIRFEKEGTYRLYVTTQRVFKGPRRYDDFSPSKIVLASNILSLTVLPDDPDWDAQRLSEALGRLNDPHVKANYRAVEATAGRSPAEEAQNIIYTNRLGQTDYARAQKSLNALDTVDGVQVRVKMLTMNTKEDLDSERQFPGGGTVYWQPLLASTTRPDLIVQALQERAERPDFGVDYDYVDWWAKYLVRRDHPEIFRPFYDQEARRKISEPYGSYLFSAKQEIVLKLEAVVENKEQKQKMITNL